MHSFASARIVRLALAPMLALWVAGAGCLMGCGLSVHAAAEPTAAPSKVNLATVVAGEACASSKSHDCCAKRRANKSPTNTHSEKTSGRAITPAPDSGVMQGCPLAVNAMAIVAKSTQKDVATVAQLPTSLVQPNLLERSGFARSAPFHLPNRGHTYLRCCVFLI
jgi:hypothetical protein